MITRFKLVSTVFFFFLSFIFITLLWGENGYFVMKSMKSNLETLNSIADEREMEVSILRERNNSRPDKNSENMELVYSFEDDGVVSDNYVIDSLEKEYVGLIWWKCALWAIVPTSVYFLLIVFIPPFMKKRNKNKKESDDNGSDN